MKPANIGLGTKQLLSLQFQLCKPHTTSLTLFYFSQGRPWTCLTLYMNITEQWHICISVLGVWNKAIKVLSVITAWLVRLVCHRPLEAGGGMCFQAVIWFLRWSCLRLPRLVRSSTSETKTVVFPIDFTHTKEYTQKPAGNLTRFLYLNFWLTSELKRFQ